MEPFIFLAMLGVFACAVLILVKTTQLDDTVAKIHQHLQSSKGEN